MDIAIDAQNQSPLGVAIPFAAEPSLIPAALRAAINHMDY